MRFSKKLSLIPFFLLTACMVGPRYKEPIHQVMNNWLDMTPKNKNKINESTFKNRIWWRSFNDSTLNELIDKAYHSNLSLQTAGVRVLQTRAELAESTGQLFPQQQALMGNYTYNRIGGSSLDGLLPPDFLTANLGFTAAWELDFWGKYRHAILSNDATFLASIAAYDSALVTLTADVADAYISLKTTDAQIKTTQANIKVQAMGLQIARARYKAGQTSLVDVEQAQTELLETESSLPSLRAQLQRQKDAVALLLGTTPECVIPFLKTKKGIPRAPRDVHVGIPKETMARRPDIYQARLQAIAQLHAIGAIKANLYPAFSLTGNFSLASNNINGTSISDIFHWNNRFITAGPSFSWPILNYGQITNAVRAQDAAFQQSLLQYMDLVLKAQKEVQDNITTFIESQKTEALLIKANRSAMSSLKLAMIRYKEGETDFTPVLNAEQQQLRVQTSLINAEGRVPQSLVALYRALGGGWEIRGGDDVVPDDIKDAMARRTNWGSLLKKQNHNPPISRKEDFKTLYLPKW